MTTDNLRHWSVLSRTDPRHTKEFQRAGGFRGTAIKPIYAYQKMTEHFGPCGNGWGMDKPEFTTQAVGDEILVFCTVGVWYQGESPKASHTVYGVGGDKVTAKRKEGSLVGDDEAFKKAYTDALTNALVKIGVSADVHMGMFEDSKYVSALRKEFAEDGNGAAPATTPAPPAAKPASAAPSRPAVRTNEEASADLKALAEDIKVALNTAESLHKLDLVMDLNRATLQRLPASAYDYLGRLYERKREAMESVT